MKLKDYFNREMKVFLFGGSLFVGFALLFNHYVAFGSLSFWDGFPSHESTGILFVLFGFGGVFFNMFSYNLPKWLRKKNNKKIVGRIINKIIKNK
jgi:hypothetical protein